MPAVPKGLRIPTMPLPKRDDDDPYTLLVLAIVQRAVLDAQGRVVHPGNRPPCQIEVEARAWLADGRELTDLLELAGFAPERVVRRARCLLATEPERTHA
jgi:hypothetical protein